MAELTEFGAEFFSGANQQSDPRLEEPRLPGGESEHGCYSASMRQTGLLPSGGSKRNGRQLATGSAGSSIPRVRHNTRNTPECATTSGRPAVAIVPSPRTTRAANSCGDSAPGG